MKYFIRYHIANDATKQIIDDICREECPLWENKLKLILGDPKYRDEQARALLGSPNGKGILFFLRSYKARLGIKTPKKVYLFHDERSAVDNNFIVEL